MGKPIDCDAGGVLTCSRFYYSWWTDGGADATYTNGPGGEYTVKWSDGGNLVGGKGYNPGGRR